MASMYFRNQITCWLLPMWGVCLYVSCLIVVCEFVLIFSLLVV